MSMLPYATDNAGTVSSSTTPKRQTTIAVGALAITTLLLCTLTLYTTTQSSHQIHTAIDPERELTNNDSEKFHRMLSEEIVKTTTDSNSPYKDSISDKQMKRIMAVAKNKWPTCVDRKMNVWECKEIIDQQIVRDNSETDRFIRTIIVGKRKKEDPLGNAVVIYMDDYDRALGRNGDGMIYYDFDWDSSGAEATNYQQRKVPPIVAEEISPEITYDSVEVNIVPLRILGSTTSDATAGTSTAPITGGIETYGTETNTEEGTVALQEALAETVTIATQGSRSIGPFDCSGMTGHSCCLMIKHKIRDANTDGQAIQCYLDYKDTTVKYKALLNARGKKVFIFENHDGKVSKEPKVVGGWPKGIADSDPDFHNWIQDGGGLSVKQMKLIHGESWEPPTTGYVENNNPNPNLVVN